jgi:hypothetical protein
MLAHFPARSHALQLVLYFGFSRKIWNCTLYVRVYSCLKRRLLCCLNFFCFVKWWREQAPAPRSAISKILSLWLYSLSDFGWFFSFLILYTVGSSPWTGDQPVARPLRTHRTTQTQNKRTQTSMRRVGFEPTTPVFERVKRVHALDRAVTVLGEHRTIAKRFVSLQFLNFYRQSVGLLGRDISTSQRR